MTGAKFFTNESLNKIQWLTMNKNFLLPLLAYITLLSSPFDARALKGASESNNQLSATVYIDIPKQEVEQKWKIAYNDTSKNGQSIIEWIPKKESLNNHSELITIQFFKHSSSSQLKARSAVEFVNAIYAQSSKVFSDMNWKVIK